MFESIKKLLPKKKIETLPQFIAQTKKEQCTHAVLKPVFFREKKETKVPRRVITVITFHIQCAAYKDSKKVLCFTKDILTYRPGTSRVQTRRELTEYCEALERSAKSMAAKLECVIPPKNITVRSLLSKK